jgi:hypothetical protein
VSTEALLVLVGLLEPAREAARKIGSAALAGHALIVVRARDGRVDVRTVAIDQAIQMTGGHDGNELAVEFDAARATGEPIAVLHCEISGRGCVVTIEEPDAT